MILKCHCCTGLLFIIDLILLHSLNSTLHRGTEEEELHSCCEEMNVLNLLFRRKEHNSEAEQRNVDWFFSTNEAIFLFAY